MTKLKSTRASDARRVLHAVSLLFTDGSHRGENSLPKQFCGCKFQKFQRQFMILHF